MKTGVGDEAFPGQQQPQQAPQKEEQALSWLLLDANNCNTTTTTTTTTAMAEYLRTELPIRLAHRIQDLDQMPGMREMADVIKVKDIYRQSFRELIQQFPTPITESAQDQAFAELLAQLYRNHSSVLVQMAKGAFQLREQIQQRQKQKRRIQILRQQFSNADDEEINNNNDAVTLIPPDFEAMQDCHHFLDRFYMSRIGIRFLAGQYLTLRNQNHQKASINTFSNKYLPPDDSSSSLSTYIGIICLETSPYAIVRQAAADASSMCRRTYGRCPTVEISGCLDLTFPYIPTYLHYILVELLKNALRATMETHETSSGALPNVKVIIADGNHNEDVVIKIADEGGGISRSQMDKIWSYLYTTASPKIQQSTFHSSTANNESDFSIKSPLAGLGYGLPISRSYCRYFGGDLDLLSMEGYGTDAFVHLKRLGDSAEPVPL